MIACALAIAMTLLSTSVYGAVTDKGELLTGTDPWSNPQFVNLFLGTYGTDPGVEPRVGPDDRAALEKILPLIAKEPAEAALLLESVIKAESSAVLDLTLANLYTQLDRVDDAASRYQIAVAKFPSFRRAWKNLGLIQVRKGQHEQAVASLSRVITLGGGDAMTYGLLGYACSAREDHLAAEAAWRNALLLQPENTDWRMGLARTVLREQKYEEAVSQIEMLIAKDPGRTDLWLLQSSAFIGMKQPMRAAENLEVVARMGKASAENLQLLGDLYINEGLYDPAANAIQRAIRLEPLRSASRALRSAEALAARGASPQARHVTAALAAAAGEGLTEEERRRKLRLESRLAVAEGSSGEAVRVLEELVALDPLDGEALLLLGQHYASAGEAERAILFYERAGNLDVYEVSAKVRQAQVLVGQSRFDEALPLLRRAQQLRPQDDVARLLEQVERVARARR